MVEPVYLKSVNHSYNKLKSKDDEEEMENNEVTLKFDINKELAKHVRVHVYAF